MPTFYIEDYNISIYFDILKGKDVAAIIFQKSGLSDVTIENGRTFPIIYPIEFNQERYETEDRQPKVLDYGGSAVEFLQLELDRLTQQEYINLRSWFKNSAINGSENNFTVIDENGESHTVRLWSDRIEPQQSSFGVYGISLILRRE